GARHRRGLRQGARPADAQDAGLGEGRRPAAHRAAGRQGPRARIVPLGALRDLLGPGLILLLLVAWVARKAWKAARTEREMEAEREQQPQPDELPRPYAVRDAVLDCDTSEARSEHVAAVRALAG